MAQIAASNHDEGLMQQALDTAAAIQQPDAQATALQAIAVTLYESGDKQRSAASFDQAIQDAVQDPDEDARFLNLSEIVTAIAEVHPEGQNMMFEQILTAAENIRDEPNRAGLARVVAAAAIRSSDAPRAVALFDHALKILATLQLDYEAKSENLETMMMSIAQAGVPWPGSLFARALDVASGISDPNRRMAAIQTVCAAATKSADEQDQPAVFEQASKLIARTGAEALKAIGLRRLAATVSQSPNRRQAADLFNRARQATLAIPDPMPKQQASVGTRGDRNPIRR